MLTSSRGFRFVTTSARNPSGLWWRWNSRKFSTPEVERSPAAPDNGTIISSRSPSSYVAVPDRVFEDDDPLPVSFEDVSRALYRIRDGIKRTVRYYIHINY